MPTLSIYPSPQSACFLLCLSHWETTYLNIECKELFRNQTSNFQNLLRNEAVAVWERRAVPASISSGVLAVPSSNGNIDCRPFAAEMRNPVSAQPVSLCVSRHSRHFHQGLSSSDLERRRKGYMMLLPEQHSGVVLLLHKFTALQWALAMEPAYRYQ